MNDFLSVVRNSRLFSGVSEEELTAMLSCLGARQMNFPKDSFCCTPVAAWIPLG